MKAAPLASSSPLLGGRERPANGKVIDIASATVVSPAVEPEPPVAIEAPVAEAPPAVEPAPSRRWIGWTAAVFGVALGVGGYETREAWWPLVQPAPTAESLALHTLDQNGQLQIGWNGASPAIRAARSASLSIVDGQTPVSAPLDAAHLQSGSFTYTRQSGRVDVQLVLTLSSGKELRQATLFTGNPVAPPPPAADPTLAAENAALKAELAAQAERGKRLEKSVADLRKLVQRDEQRKRLEHQAR
jgi:hypothetical protein